MINSEIILENIVKIVKDEKNNNIGFSKIRSYLSENFPELLESEDERIRNNCIHFINLQKKHHAATFEIEECIAWLEKQGKNSQCRSIIEAWKDMRLEVYQQASGNRHEPNYSDDTTKMFSLNDIDEIIEKINEQTEKQSEKKAVDCKNTQQEDISQELETEDERIRNWCIAHFKECIRVSKNNVEYQEYLSNKVIPWLEKQDYESQCIAESKPLADEIKFPFKAKVKKNNKIVVITGGRLDDAQPIESRIYLAYTSDITDGYKVYKPGELEFIKQPGFKVGDWVVNKLGDAWHIDSFYGENYQVSNGKGNYSYFPISKQDEMHPWTIEDAKDGDVLAVTMPTYGTWIGIFKERNGCVFSSYCFVNAQGIFKKGTYNHGTGEAAYPATKEECDLLFQKMKEAGYSWDGKLKKNTKFSKGDWIYRGTGDPYFVESVFDEQYELCSGFGYHFNKGIDEVDGDYRLWNINDAKFGDILADDKTIALYEEQSTKTFFHVLCYYCNKTFVPKKGTLAVLGFHPAIKEQREFFSNELKKSGYDLDLENKQLTDQPKLTKFEQSLKHIIEEALDDGDTHNLKADAELLLSVANQDRAKIELTEEEEDALEQAIISLNDMFDDSQPETCYAGHHVPFDVAAKCLSNLMDKILNSK